MMKGAYAEKATLMAEGGGLKLYKIEIRLPNGETTTVTAKGKDMQSALKTVLRTEDYKRLSKVPVAVWLVSYLVTAAAAAFASIEFQQPLLLVLGLFTVTVGIKVLSDSYFRYVDGE